MREHPAISLTTVDRPEKGRVASILLASVLLIAAVLAAMWPLCRAEFTTWDDTIWIKDNATLKPPTRYSLKVWWTKPEADLYVPVTYTLWGVVAHFAYVPPTDTAAGHLRAMPFHALNIALHILATLAVFGLLRLLVGRCWPALAGAMIFALHPLQVEAVGWTSGTKDVLGGALAISAMWVYLLAVRGSRQTPPADRWRWRYAGALGLFALAMLAKPAEMAIPAMALILDCIALGRSWRLALRWLWPWFLLAACCAAETAIFQNAPAAENNVAFYLRPFVALASIAFYAGKVIWPAHLAIDYGLRPDVMVHDPWLLVRCIVVIAAGIILWQMSRGAQRRLLRSGLLVFVTPILPVLGLVTFDFQSYSNVADHYLYVSMLGVAMVVAWLAATSDRRKVSWPSVSASAGFVVVLASLGWLTNRQARYWHDTSSLYHHELAVNPQSGAAYVALAQVEIVEHRYQSAADLARTALKFSPNAPKAHVVLASALWHLPYGKAKAMEEYTIGLRGEPDNTDALQGLAQARFELGQFDQAQALIRKQLQLEPMSPEGHFDLGSIYLHEGKLPEAIEELRQAVNYDPGRAKFRTVLGKALAAAGDRQAAAEQFQAAARLGGGSNP